MIKQRTTKNLGLNRSSDKEKIYAHIEDVLGIKVKSCSRANSKLNSKYGFKHEGKNPLPIRNFSLQRVYFDSKGKFHISGSGLQSYCLSCERKYRRGRLDKWLSKYSKMTDAEVRKDYRKNYGPFARCSRCKKLKKPEEFSISRRMDKGLHNVCIECSKSYLESVGSRWIVFSPDGRNSVPVKGAKCQEKGCGKKMGLHKDHIWPLSKGGTDFAENIQILCGKHNLSKSDTIKGIFSIKQIGEKMICERYQDILKKATLEKWPVEKFELEISRRVRAFLNFKKNLTNKELRSFFLQEKTRNNRKHSIERAVRKFRDYSDTAVLEINDYIAKNS